MSRASPTSGDHFPKFRPAGDRALLVEFGEVIDKTIHGNVTQLDAALSAEPFEGFIEAVPAYASVLVCFNPVLVDHLTVQESVRSLIEKTSVDVRPDALHEVDVCYDPELAPDLKAVAEASRLSPEQVVEAHLSGEYRVFMYGFAPGYAYLAGLPEPIRLPRKQAAVRGIPADSVLIAGQQCLVTTLSMPTGWWIIGRSQTPILRPHDPDRPFLFGVGDQVRFRRISRGEFEARVRP